MSPVNSLPHEPFAMLRAASKWLLISAVMGAGIAGGIYAGNVWVRGSSTEAGLGLSNYSLLDPGDRFPDMWLLDLKNGQQFELSDVTAVHPAVLVFIAQECGFCHALLAYWEKKVFPQLSDDIAVIPVFDTADTPLTDMQNYDLSYLHPVCLAATDRSAQRKEDGIVSTPTIVALEPGMTIDFIQSGFNRSVTGEFLNSRL